jgi:hypothetical protein
MPVRGKSKTTGGRQRSIDKEPRRGTRAFDRATGTVDQGVTFAGVTAAVRLGARHCAKRGRAVRQAARVTAALGLGVQLCSMRAFVSDYLALLARWAGECKVFTAALKHRAPTFGTASAWDCTTTCCTMATVPNKGREECVHISQLGC